MLAPTFVIKPTDPTAAHIVRAVPPQYPVHLIDQIRRTASIYLIALSAGIIPENCKPQMHPSKGIVAEFGKSDASLFAWRIPTSAALP